MAHADLTHRLNPDWTLRLAGRLTSGKRERFAGYTAWEDASTLVRDGYVAPGYENSASVSATASGTVQAFGREHQLVVGADWARVRTGMSGDTAFNIPILDPSRPDTWASVRPVRDGIVIWDTDDSVRQWGIFASGRFEIAPNLHAIAGGRIAWYDYYGISGNPQNGPRGEYSFSAKARKVPYVGLVYDLNDQWTAYASYTEIFMPQDYTDAAGGKLPPATGSNRELGIKASLLDGGLNLTAALFDTAIDGLPEQVTPASLCSNAPDACYRAAETVTTRGLDLELSGSPAPGWNLLAGYTFADSAYSAGPNDGTRYNPETVPRHLAKLTVSRAFDGRLQGLTLGGTLRAQSGLYSEGAAANGNIVRQKQGGYAVIDVMARYELGQDTAVQVNIDNLLDRTYLTGLGVSWPNTFFGQPRTVSVALSKTF